MVKRERWLRRSVSLLLGAVTLWVVAAASESGSVAAAVEAAEDSLHLPKLLMQWELGDSGSGTASLPTLLCLRQSPLLWASYQARQTAAEVKPVSPPAEEKPQEEPDAAPQPEVPSPAAVNSDAAQGLLFADNNAPAQTTIPTSAQSYVVAGSAYIKNASSRQITPELFDGSFAARLGSEDGPQVLILHTHGSEAYTMPPGEEYEASGSYRTRDTEKNMIRIGDEMAAVLSGYGISVVHDREIHDTDYNSAYESSGTSIEAYLQKYPSIHFVLDVHRDAISDADGRQYKLVSQEDSHAAQVSIVMGSNYDQWLENLRLAVAVQQTVLASRPTLMRPVIVRGYGYNQGLSTGSLLVEIGTAGNSLDEAIYAGRLFAAGFAETIGGTRQQSASGGT